MERIVLDTHAAAAFFYNEPGADKAEKTIISALAGSGKIFMSAVNYGELFYAVLKKSGRKAAMKAVHMLDAVPVGIIDADKNLSLLAGSIKADKRMSYADCFAAATAKILNAVLLTGDPEFKEVEKEIKIMWI